MALLMPLFKLTQLCSFLRVENVDDSVEITYLMAKTRVASLKKTSYRQTGTFSCSQSRKIKGLPNELDQPAIKFILTKSTIGWTQRLLLYG